MLRLSRRLRRNDRGATAIEYGLIAGLLALGIVGALSTTRNSLRQDYTCVATQVGSQGSGSCSTAAAAPAAPLPTPTTALGYAQQMVPPGYAITGETKDTSGQGYYWYANSADPSVVGNHISLTAYSGSGFSPAWGGFQGDVVSPNVVKITSWTGAVNAPAGTTIFGIVSPKGMILVNTIPST